METSPGATDVSISAHLRKAEQSTLESDVALLKCMQDLSQKMVSRADKLVRDLQQLEKDSIAACVGVENCVQNLNLISTKQYMEKRVYDEEVKEKKEETLSAPSSTKNDSPDFVPKIKEALSHVLPVLRTNHDQFPTQNGGKQNGILNEADYSLRPLPWIVGTSDFLECPFVGIPFHYDEQNGSSDTTSATLPNTTVPDPVEIPKSSSASFSQDSGTQDNHETSEFTAVSNDDRLSEPEVENEEIDEQPKSHPNFSVLQRELASRLKVPVFVPTEPENDYERETTSDNDKSSLPQTSPPNFSRNSISSTRSKQQQSCQQQAQQQHWHQQYQQQAAQKRRTLFDDSSESDDDDLFKASSSKSVQPPAPRPNVPNPMAVPVPVAVPVSIPPPVSVDIPPPIKSAIASVSATTPVPVASATSVQTSIPAITAPVKPTNGTPSGRSFLFDSSDDDDDLFATSKPVTKSILPAPKPSVDDNDDDLFSIRPTSSGKPVAPPALTTPAVQTATSAVPNVVPVASTTATTAAVKANSSGANGQSLFEDDDDDVSKIFPANSTPQQPPPNVTAPTVSIASAAVPKRGISTSLFGNDSDSDDDIFKNIVPKKPGAVKVLPAPIPDPSISNRPVEPAPTSKVNPQAQNHTSQRLTSQDQKSSFPPEPASVPTPKVEPKPFKSDIPPASAPLLHKNEPAIQKANAPSETDGKSTSLQRPTTLPLSDDSDDDLFKPRPSIKVPVAPPVPISHENIANVGFLKTPEEEAKDPIKPLSPNDRSSGLVASLKLSLAKQPMGMLNASPTSQSPPGMRKPFAGVPIFGITPTNPLTSVVKQASPEKEEAAVCQPTSDGSLPCLGRDRPRAPKHRRLPSRSHRRSMIVEEGEVPVDEADRGQVPDGSIASTPISPNSETGIVRKPIAMSEAVAALPVPISDKCTRESSLPSPSKAKTVDEVPIASESHSLVKSEPLASVLTNETKRTVEPVGIKPKEPERPTTNLFSDSDDSSDGELFAKLSKPAPVSRANDNQTKTADLVETAALPVPAAVSTPAPTKANAQSLFGEESDSDDGLFAGRKSTTPAAAAAKKSSGFQAFADSDSDDDLFASKRVIRGPPDRKEPAKAPAEHASSSVVISDPLLGFHDQ